MQVTFGNGIKREEYGPLKKAEVSIIAIVNTGEDGVIALNYISSIAQDKVREMLTIQGQPAAAAAEPSSTETATALGAAVVGEGEQPEKRTRRTKAEMEAARAAEASTGSAAAEPAATAASETQAVDTTSTTSAASAGEANEWEAAAPAEVTITDQELNHTCSVTAERTSKPLAVREVIKLFNPGGDAFDPDKPGGRKFSIADIPQNQRADFIAKLKAL